MRAWPIAVLLMACGGGGGGGSTPDAAPPDSGRDGAACPTPVTVTQLGDDCISFGAGDPCDPSCGLGAFGYSCYGGRPDLAGCVRVSESTVLGTGTYCCATLACAHVTTLDSQCGGTQKMFQCPEDGAGQLLVQPPSGCVRKTQPPPYQYFCCP